MSAHVHQTATTSSPAAPVRDSVCGVHVDPTGIQPSVEHDGDRYHFCSQRLVKNAEAFERFAKLDTLIVESTGTLTKGKPRLVAVIPETGHDQEEVLHLAASL